MDPAAVYLMKASPRHNPAGLYIHIPFCMSKCPYCNFHSTTSLGETSDYLGALLKEMEMYRDTFTSFDTVIWRRHPFPPFRRTSGCHPERHPSLFYHGSRLGNYHRNQPCGYHSAVPDRSQETWESIVSISAFSPSTTRSYGSWDAGIPPPMPCQPLKQQRHQGFKTRASI